MTVLHSFKDNDRKGRWANIRMDNGDPCWVSVARTGILVKKSKLGLMGVKLFEERDAHKAVNKARTLGYQFPDDLTPDDMRNHVLKLTVNAVLHCKTLEEVKKVLNEDFKPQRPQSVQEPISFAEDLLAIANQHCKANELPESDDIEDAAVITLTHYFLEVLEKSTKISMVDCSIDEDTAINSAIFLHMAGNHIVLCLEREGTELSINNILSRTSLAVYKFLDSEKIPPIMNAGVEQYKSIIKAGNEHQMIRSFTDKVDEMVRYYPRLKDERLIDICAEYYDQLLLSWNNRKMEEDFKAFADGSWFDDLGKSET